MNGGRRPARWNSPAVTLLVVALGLAGWAASVSSTPSSPAGTDLRASVAPDTVVGSIAVGDAPTSVAFDPDTGELYVTNYGSNNVTVISGSTDAVVGAVTVAGAPADVVFDSANRNLYVTEDGSDQVAVIDGATDQVVGSVDVGSTPNGVAFDGANRDIYVANEGSANLSIINGGTGSVVGSPDMNGPQNIGLDSTNGDLYVTTGEANLTDVYAVAVVSGTTNQIVDWVPVGAPTWGVAFDPVNGCIYVTMSSIANFLLGESVQVISTTSAAVLATIPVGESPEGVAYDAANGDLYVANAWSDNVTVIDSASNSVVASIPVSVSPIGLAVDPANGYVYVTNFGSNNVTVIDGGLPSTVSSTPYGLAWPGGYVLVAAIIGFAAVAGAMILYSWRERGPVSVPPPTPASSAER